jgi:hypothetical protein
VSRTVTIPQVITGMTVDSYGAPVQVQSGDVSRVQVTERLLYGSAGKQSMYGSAGKLPAVAQTVSGRHLTLAGTLNADSGGGSEIIQIATDPGVHRSITITSGGGPLLIRPGDGAGF